MAHASRFGFEPLIHPTGTHPTTSPARLPEPYVPGELTEKFLNSAPEKPVTSDMAEDFRHGGWMPFRRRVEQALSTTHGITPRRLSAFRSCGCDAFVETRQHVAKLGPGAAHGTFGSDFRIRSTKCHDRFCVPCSQERSNRIRRSLLTHMKPLNNLKLITLTLAASEDKLSTILDRITRAFRALRSKSIWKKNVQGGVSIIETKLGKNSGTWHVHFHVVAESKYIKQAMLSETWLAITGDSRVVDIRPVGAKTGAVQYITKYVTKAADHSIVMSEKHLKEAIIGFTGRRLVSTFGSWRGLELMEKPTHENDFYEEDGCRYPKPEWRSVGRLEEILTAAASGEAWAVYAVRKLKRGGGTDPPNVRSVQAIPG